MLDDEAVRSAVADLPWEHDVEGGEIAKRFVFGGFVVAIAFIDRAAVEG